MGRHSRAQQRKPCQNRAQHTRYYPWLDLAGTKKEKQNIHAYSNPRTAHTSLSHAQHTRRYLCLIWRENTRTKEEKQTKYPYSKSRTLHTMLSMYSARETILLVKIKQIWRLLAANDSDMIHKHVWHDRQTGVCKDVVMDWHTPMLWLNLIMRVTL